MTGTTLGHYRITAELGRGGMGIVYKAEDTKLERTVAIKVLPSNALASEEDRARFYREAKAAAQLNHPNIAAIHQIDEAVPEGSPPGTAPSPFIAMEFIDGDALDERIRQRPMPIKECVRLAKAVASALQVAHEKQIVHRDIKSANVMLTARGDPKVLDFGLAKTAQSTMLTRMGSTMGTVAYMSPEQARGEEVDGRSDLWSLGVVIYEMVAGRVPFSTDYEQAAVYSILNEDPEALTALRTGVPMELERIVGKLLSKEARLRYQTAADLIADLDALDLKHIAQHSTMQTTSIPAAAAAANPSPLTTRTLISGAALLGILMLTLGWLMGRSGADDGNAADIARHASVMLPGMGTISHPSISPDGRYMSFTTDRNGLWLYDFSRGSLSILDQGGDIRMNDFSSDGRWLAYEARGNNIYIVQTPDGVPALLLEHAVLPEWIDDTSLLVSDVSESGLDQFNRITGERAELYRAGENDPAISHTRVLPGGKKALVSMLDAETRHVGLMDLADGDIDILIRDAFAPRYVESGHILFSRGNQGVTSYDGEVFAQPFDVSSGKVRGQPIKVMGERGYWEFDVNSHGDMVTSIGLDGEVQQAERDVYVWDAANDVIDDTGIDLRLSSSAVWLSADGEWLLYDDQENEQLMYGRLADARFAPIPNVVTPIWNAVLSEADDEVFYTSGQLGTGMAVYRQRLDGSGQPEQISFGEAAHQVVIDARGDSDFLVVSFESVTTPHDLSHVDTRTGVQTTIGAGLTGRTFARISPNGRWVVWHRRGDDGIRSVLVSGIDGSGPWEIARGYAWPMWSADGSAIYMFNTEENALFKTSVAITTGVRPEGRIVKVHEFQGEAYFQKRRDSDTFLLQDRPNDRIQTTQAIDVILSWGARLQELAPVN